MNLRLALAWVREQMLTRACHRIAVGPDQAAKEDELWDAAVAEVDGLLCPEEAEVEDAWADPEWVEAMGGEMAGVS